MADAKTAELLEAWGFGHLVTRFQEQSIDYQTLVCLPNNEKEVEQLLPLIGLRVKFKTLLSDHLSVLQRLERSSTPESLPSTVSVTSSVFSSTSDDSAREGVLSDLLQLEKDLLLATDNVQNLDSINFDDSLKPNNTESENATESHLVTDCETKDAANDENQPPTSIPASNTIVQSQNIFNNFAQLNLKDLLLESPTGRMVLAMFEKDGKFDKSTRLRLVQTVIRSLVQKLSPYDRETLKNEHFKVLAMKIENLFPGEESAIYYIAPSTEGPDQSISKGRLPVRYRNELREFRKCGFFITKKSKSTSLAAATTSSDPDEDLSEDCIRECTVHSDWLKHNTAPWPSVEEHWLASQPLRFEEYKKIDGSDVSSIFEQWPVLKQPTGYLLLEKDFSGLFDDKLSMYAEWPEFSRKVQSIMQTEVKGRQYQELLTLLAADTVSEGARVVLILNLLPALCPPVARIKKTKGYWRPTIVESLNGFIRHVKTAGDLQPEIQRRIEQMNKLKLRVQPYVIIVGPELTSIENSYVIIDNNTIYHSESTLKAVDICFKAFHVLHAQYPVESEQIWLLLQKCIYKINTKWDKQISSTLALVTQINGR